MIVQFSLFCEKGTRQFVILIVTKYVVVLHAFAASFYRQDVHLLVSGSLMCKHMFLVDGEVMGSMCHLDCAVLFCLNCVLFVLFVLIFMFCLFLGFFVVSVGLAYT